MIIDKGFATQNSTLLRLISLVCNKVEESLTEKSKNEIEALDSDIKAQLVLNNNLETP